MLRPLRLLCLWMLLCTGACAYAQSDPLAEPRMERVGDTRSINDGVVTALAQDENGLLWIGTTVGLVRYDGYQLRPVPVRSAPAGAPQGASHVRSLLAAPGGVLWVGLEGEGLARLDIASNVWTVYRPDATRAGALASGTVRALALDAEGVLWVGTTGGGLYSLAPGEQTFRAYRRASGDLPDDRVHALRVDRQGSLWVGTWSGLLRKRRGETRFEPVLSSPQVAESLAGRIVSMIAEAPDGRLWVGTRQGDLAVLEPGSGQARWLQRAGLVVGNDSAVLSMAWADERELWIGRESGIDVRRVDDGTLVKHLRRDLRKPWGLAGHNVVALLRDQAGNLWVGSYGGGLQRHSARPGLWVRHGDGREGSVFAEANVRSLHQMRNGEIWAGTNERGVAVLDARLQLLAEIPPEPQRPRGFGGGLVGAITQTADGHIWVGADSELYEFSESRRLLARHQAGQGRPRRLMAARDGTLWVGTQDGVYRRDGASGRFLRVALADGGVLSGNVNALAESADGTVWVGGNNGLYRAAPGQPVLAPVLAVAGAGLLKPVVLGLLMDRQQMLWVDTSAGLHRMVAWDGRSARFQPVTDSQGADSRASFGANLLEDAQGRIWTHQTVYDPRDDSRYELSQADGVDIGTGWFRAYTKLADGRLLYGGSTGILVVESDRFRPWDHVPPVVVSDLRIDGERVPLARLQGQLRLRPPEGRFSVEFAALDYGHPERNRYRYRLQGFDSAWIESGSDFRVASYGNLPPGRYTLQLQGSNRVGAWSPRELLIPVEVLPAWWQTWWARVGGVVLAALLVWSVVSLRTRLLRRQQAVLELRVRERTEALQALSQQLQLKTQALEASSLTDPLTGLHNRRFLAQNIEADVALAVRRAEQALRSGTPPPEDADLVFFVIDIDHFKQVNDAHGHTAGDAVLMQMRERLQQAFRQGDHLVRWGGEEFLIVARGTSRHRAAELAERVRHLVADTPFRLDDGTLLQRTCSVGFAAFPPAPAHPGVLSWAAVVDIADAALFAVKRSGRDGWLGVVKAEAESAAALKAASAGTLQDWRASGRLEVAMSEGLDARA
ncbi:ligand-binding sensor domain-containing protein [Rubrivivax rivuli]|uniref:diguanylate cyclase n=1 Tax=Rubrivivax rivuli TaxID=1862385 RepID=A0A437RSL2_9BURK|nr:ligand-binding sensor domain-containing diguanylate cyclase [Rubrivivax rivuli]RVU49747.1 GGDEF domain-containing protein [Rubrivivax rivuli]